ncbi:proline dehydrogenase family protein (plasmid) [Bacillus sp. CMF21]|uniref:proline dehydrogenase family protein n=1 Tax=Metabacillus dongyingensis TaxID=2874282 RepID=UPI001FB22F75|nr:proline dehydrogenase family protein [Metabacillus dongyingensis]UNJ81275.1 Proline dehydrogenase [Metabacillus dongyingensis]USK31237.1 proline dehydrogenase family protein [Bacillus sp. CMF21]
MELLLIEKQFADALKSVARNLEIKEYIQQSSELYPLFQSAAKRFVTGESREDGLSIGDLLINKGYRISLESIGENTTNKEECVRAKDEFIALMRECGNRGISSRISFDLSHIGLSVDPELAYQNLLEMAKEAQFYNLSLMISMEESAKTDQILYLYKRVVVEYPNVGVTLQAQLHRTLDDLNELLNYPGAIRIVKGAYQEPSDICIPRSDELDQRYLELVDLCVKAGHQVSIASHDEAMYKQIMERGYLQNPYVEAEMLYGIRPELCKQLKDKGLPVRVYLTYGMEWYLYLTHRIAEYPPNIYVAITDMIRGEGNSSQFY